MLLALLINAFRNVWTAIPWAMNMENSGMLQDDSVALGGSRRFFPPRWDLGILALLPPPTSPFPKDDARPFNLECHCNSAPEGRLELAFVLLVVFLISSFDSQ